MKQKRKFTPIAVAFLTVAIGALIILAEVRISNVRKDLLNYAARDAASAAATAGIEKSLDTDRCPTELFFCLVAILPLWK